MKLSNLKNLFLNEDETGFLFLYHPSYGGFNIFSEIAQSLIQNYNWSTTEDYDTFKNGSIDIWVDKSHSNTYYSLSADDFTKRTHKNIIQSFIDVRKKHSNCEKYGIDKCQSDIHRLRLAVRQFDFDDLINDEYDGFERTNYPDYKLPKT